MGHNTWKLTKTRVGTGFIAALGETHIVSISFNASKLKNRIHKLGIIRRVNYKTIIASLTFDIVKTQESKSKLT